MINPVLRKEIKILFRGWRPFYAVALYVLAFAVIANIAIANFWSNSYMGFNPDNVVICILLCWVSSGLYLHLLCQHWLAVL